MEVNMKKGKSRHKLCIYRLYHMAKGQQKDSEIINRDGGYGVSV